MAVNGFLVGNEVQKYNYEYLENYNTPDFSTSSTYQVGDYVMYQGKLYKCTTAITTSGAWDYTKWSLAILSDDVADLKSAIAQGGSFNAEVKAALDQFTASVLQLAQKVAYINDSGQDYYDDIDDAADALHSAMYPPVNLSYITAVYTQSGTVYNTDSLDSLKDDLVVTAHYSDSTTGVVTNYVLSGTLTVGTSTITVTYGGKTASFSVTVVDSWTLEWDYTDGELPNSDDWIVDDNQSASMHHTISFESDKGIKWEGYGWGYIVSPKNYQHSTEAIMEAVFNYQSLATSQYMQVGLELNDTFISGMLTPVGLKINAIANDPIADTVPTANTDYTIRVERSANEGKVYLNGVLKYTGEFRALAGQSNLAGIGARSKTTSSTIYIKAIRFKHISD